MKMRLTLLYCVGRVSPVWLFVLVQIVTGEFAPDSIFGTIAEDTPVFYRKLPFAPSKVANIKYSILYKSGSFCSSQFCRAVFLLYFVCSQDTMDVGNCSKIRDHEPFHKIFVGNLPSSLQLNEQSSLCRGQTMMGNNVVHCTGDTKVQHYKPCGFALGFMFRCEEHEDHIFTSNGLQYNVTIHSQSNFHTCELIKDKVGTKMCRNFYHYTSFPNILGATTIDEASDSLEKVQLVQIAFESEKESSGVNSYCHQHFQEIVCHLLLPPCDNMRQEAKFLCREMCLELVQACFKNFAALKNTNKLMTKNHVFKRINTTDDMNWICDHFPSNKDKDVNCFYKPVVCGQPPVVQNTKINRFRQTKFTLTPMRQRIINIILSSATNVQTQVIILREKTQQFVCLVVNGQNHQLVKCIQRVHCLL